VRFGDSQGHALYEDHPPLNHNPSNGLLSPPAARLVGNIPGSTHFNDSEGFHNSHEPANRRVSADDTVQEIANVDDALNRLLAAERVILDAIDQVRSQSRSFSPSRSRSISPPRTQALLPAPGEWELAAQNGDVPRFSDRFVSQVDALSRNTPSISHPTVLGRLPAPGAGHGDDMFGRLDANRDGVIDRNEWNRAQPLYTPSHGGATPSYSPHSSGPYVDHSTPTPGQSARRRGKRKSGRNTAKWALALQVAALELIGLILVRWLNERAHQLVILWQSNVQ